MYFACLLLFIKRPTLKQSQFGYQQKMCERKRDGFDWGGSL